MSGDALDELCKRLFALSLDRLANRLVARDELRLERRRSVVGTVRAVRHHLSLYEENTERAHKLKMSTFCG